MQSWGTENFPISNRQKCKTQKNGQTSIPKFIVTIKENTDVSHELRERKVE